MKTGVRPESQYKANDCLRAYSLRPPAYGLPAFFPSLSAFQLSAFALVPRDDTTKKLYLQNEPI